MEEINLKELGTYFLSHITIILGVMAVIFIVGCIYSVVIKKTMYHGTTSIVLVSQNTEITNSDIQVNRNLVETYTQIIKSGKILSGQPASAGMGFSGKKE